LFHRTSLGAPVFGARVSIITPLASYQHAVPTYLDTNVVLVALPAVLHLAGLRASIPCSQVAVITTFIPHDEVVTADLLADRASVVATPPRLYLTGRGAPVSRRVVSVITLFIEVHLTVSARKGVFAPGRVDQAVIAAGQLPAVESEIQTAGTPETVAVTLLSFIQGPVPTQAPPDTVRGVQETAGATGQVPPFVAHLHTIETGQVAPITLFPWVYDSIAAHLLVRVGLIGVFAKIDYASRGEPAQRKAQP
jgi:hypothetical protein